MFMWNIHVQENTMNTNWIIHIIYMQCNQLIVYVKPVIPGEINSRVPWRYINLMIELEPCFYEP